jgi:hypothetical protein
MGIRNWALGIREEAVVVNWVRLPESIGTCAVSSRRVVISEVRLLINSKTVGIY